MSRSLQQRQRGRTTLRWRKQQRSKAWRYKSAGYGGQQVLAVAPGLVNTDDGRRGRGWKLVPACECQGEEGNRLKVLKDKQQEEAWAWAGQRRCSEEAG